MVAFGGLLIPYSQPLIAGMAMVEQSIERALVIEALYKRVSGVAPPCR